jgi:hypothetical protein
MTKRNFCKICGGYAGKSDTCKNCKEKYPYLPARKNENTFERKKLFDKDNKLR